MASGTISGMTSNIRISCYLAWASVPDEDANTSTVTATLYYKRTDGYGTYGTGQFSISIGGQVFNQTEYVSIGGDNPTAAMKATAVISHDVDGTKSINIKATGEIDGTTLHYTLLEGTAVLDNIPRSTLTNSLSCSTSYLDGVLTYKYTPRTPYYVKANISLNLNGNFIRIRSILHGKKTAGVQQTQNVVFSASELSLIYKELSKATKGAIRVTIRTYYDADYTQEATDNTYKEINLTIPTAVKPTTSLAVTLINDNAWIKGKGICVAGYSGLSATLTATAGEGASLSSYSVTGGDYSSDTNKLSIDKILDHGQHTITGKAIDSRGRSGSASKTITVEPYFLPSVASLEVARGTYAGSKWTADDDGTDVRVIFKTTLALSNYSNNYSAAFALDGSAITPNAGTTSGLASGTAYTVYFLNVDGENSHNLKISTTDAVGRVGSATITIATVNVTIEFNGSGRGIAFGKTSEKEAFECAWDAEFSGSLAKKRPDGSLVEVDDTGWIDMGTSGDVSVADASDTGRNGPGCYYRVINKCHVYVAFNVAFAFSGAAIVINANALPSALRPARKAYAMSLVSGRAFARTGVNTSGNVIIDWVQDINTTETTQAAETTWIDGYIDYWIE